ncbi:hypothetical protein MJO28_014645 [Puccinia striiformis f. sp. tritici]|uniref:Uncharacterized protein n=1 Tax=Puccinia striiformis f. sp. tritici TaxID=168172 RepID=A0ACC0DVA3_9BASI|nr:hypothetical protein MJO28_014645 [Puccinia striiformis f. sp. tritici]
MARTRSKRKRLNPIVESDRDDSENESIAKSVAAEDSIEVAEVPPTQSSQPSVHPTQASGPQDTIPPPQSQSINDPDPPPTDSTDQSKKTRSDVWIHFKKSGSAQWPRQTSH